MTLSVAQRVAVGDAAAAAVRACMREAGLAEVATPVRLPAVAIEPWIEPVAAPPGVLATSPELPMKQLLCRGAPAIFQIAPCLRRSERGRVHAEEFRLLEWYRLGGDPDPIMRDVERIVSRVAIAVGEVTGRPSPLAALSWRRESFFDLFERTTGVVLGGAEDARALSAAIAPRRPDWIGAIAGDDEVATLQAWTALFSAWSDAALDPWLASLGEAGVHVVDFPAPLAALAEIEIVGDRVLAHRFESHAIVAGRTLELANGYRELRDAAHQRRRFEIVAELRARHGLAALPMPEAFLADLASIGLPPCAGAALGLDRSLMLAAGADALHEVALLPDAPLV